MWWGGVVVAGVRSLRDRFIQGIWFIWGGFGRREGGRGETKEGTDGSRLLVTQAQIVHRAVAEESRVEERSETKAMALLAATQASPPTSSIVAAAAAPALAPLKVLTYNIYFGEKGFARRLGRVLEILQEHNADVVCLQEVTKKSEKVIKSRLASAYDCSGNTIDRYGVLVFAKKELAAEFFEIQLPTTMGRTLVCARTAQHIVASAHFESLDNHAMRLKQLNRFVSPVRVRNWDVGGEWQWK